MTRKVSSLKVECLRNPLQFLSRLWYNIPVKGDDTMSEASASVNLNFMYLYCGKHRYAMSECLAIPEVKDRLSFMARNGETVDKQVFASTLKEVYAYKAAHKKDNPTFCYASARKILKELGEVIPTNVS